MPDLSVILPVINELKALPSLLDDLRTQRGITFDIIVCDGGSDDGTVAYVRALNAPNIRLIETTTGRAAQMNAGARASKAPWLFFLHADSTLSSDVFLSQSLKHLLSLHSATHPVVGHCVLRFHQTPQPKPLRYAFLEAKTATNRPYTINGDQGCLISRELFERVEGYDGTWGVMEDQRLVEATRACGARWVCLPDVLGTSARRFEREGFAQRYIIMGIMMSGWRCGFRPLFERIHDLYPQHDQSEFLTMTAFLHTLRGLVEDMDPQDIKRLWAHVGVFAAENAWQVGLLIDVAMKQRIWTHCFDRVVAPLLQTPQGARVLTRALQWVMMDAMPRYWARRERA